MKPNTASGATARENLSVVRERALLVGVLVGGVELEDPLAESRELARSAGAEVVDEVLQRRHNYHPATCVGQGKLEEIRQRADATSVDVIVFDNDLSPSQIREIERATSRKVIDRTELILDIFASRARTAEARLQVELAQLEYTSPRLRGMWTHLERIAGAGGGSGVGAVGGIGTRGPGERQIEIDRRIVGRRIAFLQRKIEEIDRRKVRTVQARRDFFTISLVGYTNAGKSTLMNALTGADAVAEDRLFATLDTLTRRWELGDGASALLSDTVGFIRNLPHSLVASFRATLEEVLHADLLLHVVDASNHGALKQIEAVETVLGELNALDRPQLLVLNKVDAVEDELLIALARTKHPDAIAVSARSGAGLDQLRSEVLQRVRGTVRATRLRLPAADGRTLDFLERHARVFEREFVEDEIRLRLDATPAVLAQARALSHDRLLVE